VPFALTAGTVGACHEDPGARAAGGNGQTRSFFFFFLLSFHPPDTGS